MLAPKQEENQQTDSANLSHQPKLMLFDLSVGGHHAAYIQHLIHYWNKHQLSGRLSIVVVPEFLKKHQDVVEMARSQDKQTITFIPIAEEEAASLGTRKSALKRKIRNLQEWKLFHKYAHLVKPDECLLMYFDTCQSSIRFFSHNLPCPVSGIYFRPRFHYSDFQPGAFSWKDKLWHWWERNFIFKVVQHPQFKTLFCLDDVAVKYFDRVNTQAQIIHLPDPVQVYSHGSSEVEQIKSSLGIEPGRRVFLLFGVLNGRKGLHKTLDAISLLSPELCRSFCLLLVGPTNPELKEMVKVQIENISKSRSAQIIERYEFILDRDIQSYFLVSDVVMAAYQSHIGTSSILVRAAAAGKPVLSTDYGLMGEWTRHHQLGIAVNSAEPNSIAQAMTQFLQESPQKFCDRAKMQKFAEENSAENYARVIFQHLAG